MFYWSVILTLSALLVSCADSSHNISVTEPTQRMRVSDAVPLLCNAGIEISPRPSFSAAEPADLPIVTLGITCAQGFSFGVTMDADIARSFFGPDRLQTPTALATYIRLDGNSVSRETTFRLSDTEDLHLVGTMGPAYLLTEEGSLGAEVDPTPASALLLDPAAFTCRSYASVDGVLTPLPDFCTSALRTLDLPPAYVPSEINLADLR